MQDQFGIELAVGDRVMRTAVDRGAPAWAREGRIVGMTPNRIEVEWHGANYDYRPFASRRTAFTSPHRCNPTVVRKLQTA